MKIFKIISVLCLSVRMIGTGLPASASGQPTREQAESINLIVSRMVPKVTDECVQFNPKHQRVYVTEIRYWDYIEGLVDYGTTGYLARAFEYHFSNGMITSVNILHLYEDGVMKFPWLEISADKTRLQITERGINFITHKEKEPVVLRYVMKNGSLKLQDFSPQTRTDERRFEIIQTEEGLELYAWGFFGRQPAWKIRRDGDLLEFHNDDGSYMKYENGILMERHLGNNAPARFGYTTANGIGQYRKIGEDGEVEPILGIERKTDEDGYLIYERQEPPGPIIESAGKTEIFIGEEYPDVTGLANRMYSNPLPPEIHPTYHYARFWTYAENIRQLDFSKLDSKLTDSYLIKLKSKSLLRVLRNAVYARHGRLFGRPDLQVLWDSCPWYKRNPGYTDDLLTETDQYNISLIQKYEERLRNYSYRPFMIAY